MATPIHDRYGDVVGWLNDSLIRGLDGNAEAFIRGENVYDYGGRHLGRFRKGFFRNHYADAVAFVEWAEGLPLRPRAY